MQTARFGRTDLNVSRLTFGCGAVGGLMTKGEATDQDRAVAWARDNGINFFDTAASYGDGASETNLGRALAGNTDGIIVATKVGVPQAELGKVGQLVEESLHASLKRLRLDHVDLFQLHNTIDEADRHGTINATQILEEIVPVFEKMRDAGKTRYIGFTAKGDVAQLHQLVESGRFDSAQIFYNLLVPSAGEPALANYPADDFKQLLDVSADNGVGAIGVRVLAGGALSGREERHPLGMPKVAPIGSPTDYATDVKHALKFSSLIDDDFASSLPELATRYVISNPILPTTEIGIATLEQLQLAADAVNKGPLADEALKRIRDIQASLVA
jgi:L-galactose dehydrogenase/L-glyceraldehyde 3-phosphate reductase